MTHSLPLDQFFTPSGVAERVVQATDIATISSCLDPNCGSGNLLQACADAFPKVRCFGIDKDSRAVAELRRRYPLWRLATADILIPSSGRRSAVWQAAVGSDCILVNPPFSMAGTKGIWVYFDGRLVRCSVAMGHLMTTLDAFQPRDGGAAIVPESMMYSELDEAARQALASRYSLQIVEGLKNCTFRGARANALIVRIRPRGRGHRGARAAKGISSSVRPDIVRGGLPLFEARRRVRGGLPLVHSTDLTPLRESSEAMRALARVRPIERGVVSGPVILLPRVGIPSPAVTRPVSLLRKVQLSDCVIALCFSSMRAARAFGRALESDWGSFLAIYRGTGARYTTMRALSEWCGV